MSANKAFSDSNVLIYLVSADESKVAVANEILRADLTISVQILNEIASVMLGKLRQPWNKVENVLALVRSASTVHPIDLRTHAAGMAIAKRYKLGVYDSMVVAAALLANCDTLYSEDMHTGLVIENRLTIVNPFLA
jgi:predicted nucleic acid-binding protein